MHILFMSPFYKQPRGNSTTIRRLEHFLARHNIKSSVFAYLENGCNNPADGEIIHILHATRFFKWMKEQHFSITRPYIITMGGTDINIDLQSKLEPDMFAFLDQARFITVFTEDAKQKVCILNPGWAAKTFVIPQGIWVPWDITDSYRSMNPDIFLPAGLRPVKDVLHALPALDELKAVYPDLTFTIAGANLDENVHKQVLSSSAQRSWLSYKGTIPFEMMKFEYERAQIVLNTSLSEGQPLALMEAMAAGVPVIARKNKANQQMIQHLENGWLYESMSEFIGSVHSIIHDATLRTRITRQAKDWIAMNFSPEREADAYRCLYKELID